MAAAPLAAIRPADWELPLFVHVLGGMALVGTLVLALVYLAGAWRGGEGQQLRLAYRTLLYGALPSFIVLRASAQWIGDEQGLIGEDPPAWIEMGFIVTDAGLLLMLIAMIAAGVALRRARRAGAEPGTGAARTATVLLSVLLVAYVASIWAMTTKPG